MASINLDLNYFGHIKTLRLVARLGPGSDVLPIKIWVHAGNFHPKSDRLELLEAEIEPICNWWGEKGAMVAAMIEIGFLKREGESVVINDWFVHSGHLAAFKKRAEKAAKIRWGIKRKSSNASSIAKGKPKQSPSRAVPNLPNLPNQPATAASNFKSLWKDYPRKLGRDAAERHFKAQVKTPSDWLDIQLALANFNNHLAKKGTDEDYIPHGSTWFNGRWRDWITYSGATVPKAPTVKVVRKPEIHPPDPTAAEIKEMHNAKVRDLGVCRVKDCAFCGTERN